MAATMLLARAGCAAPPERHSRREQRHSRQQRENVHSSFHVPSHCRRPQRRVEHPLPARTNCQTNRFVSFELLHYTTVKTPASLTRPTPTVYVRAKCRHNRSHAHSQHTPHISDITLACPSRFTLHLPRCLCAVRRGGQAAHEAVYEADLTLEDGTNEDDAVDLRSGKGKAAHWQCGWDGGSGGGGKRGVGHTFQVRRAVGDRQLSTLSGVGPHDLASWLSDLG